MPNNMYCTCAVYSLVHFYSNLIFVSLPDEGSRMLLKRCILFFGFTDADMRVTENAMQYIVIRLNEIRGYFTRFGGGSFFYSGLIEVLLSLSFFPS